MLTARRGALALIVIILSSLAFRVHVSTECSFWLDEVVTHLDVLKPWPAVFDGPSRAHPPLMYVVVKSVIEIIGESETRLRLVSLFFGCVLLAATHELGLALGLKVGPSLLAVATLALTPFFIQHATEARHYAMVAALTTLATTRALRWLSGPRPRMRDLIGFAATALAAAYTHYFGVAYALALLGCVVIGIAPAWKQARPWRRAAMIGILVVLLVALCSVAVRAAAVGRSYAGDAQSKPLLDANFLLKTFGNFALMRSETWALAIELPLALLGLVLLTWRLRGVARLLPLGIGIAPVVAALFISSRHFVAVRYLAPSLVFYHLGAWIAVLTAFDRVRIALASRARWGPFASLPAGVALAAVLAARLREYPEGFGAGGDDYRGLQRYFVSKLAKDTRLVTYVGSAGELLMGKEYSVGSRPIRLERFRPVKGIDRYLVIEVHVESSRRPALEKLIRRQLGVSAQRWRSLPLVPLPHSIYQSPVSARLVDVSSEAGSPSPPRKRHQKP
jgi:hypothetical protein